MTKKLIYIFTLLTAVMIAGCKNDDTVGIALQPDIDAISAQLDTFVVNSRDIDGCPISAQCDTIAMLLGNYYSQAFGTTKAELLLQFAAPEGYNFPEADKNPEPDSLLLILTYNGFCGAANEPFELAVYEMNGQVPQYTTLYTTDLNVGDFCDKSILMGKQMRTSLDQTLSEEELEDENYQPYIAYKFSDEHLQRFFNMPRNAYESTEAFLQEFKGVYITPTFGQSTMLYLREAYLQLHYHYTYQRADGTDTVMTTYITFPANHEVRQLNHIEHPDNERVLNVIDSVNTIKSAGGIFTEIEIPIGRIRQRVFEKIGNKTLMINSAPLSLEIVNSAVNEKNLPLCAYMIMMPSNQIDNFIKNNQVPYSADTNMVIGYYNTTPNREYRFDLAYFLAQRMRENPLDYDETLKMVILPIATTTLSNGEIGAMRPLKQLSGVQYRNGKNNYSPLRIEITYSGL